MAQANNWRDAAVVVLDRWRPRGYYVKEGKPGILDMTWCFAWFSKRLIQVPYLDSRMAITVCLHEFAHVHLKHDRVSLTESRREFEAWKWAIMVMEIEGLYVRGPDFAEIRHLVREAMERDVRRGVEVEDAIWRFVFA